MRRNPIGFSRAALYERHLIGAGVERQPKAIQHIPTEEGENIHTVGCWFSDGQMNLNNFWDAFLMKHAELGGP